MSFFNNRLVHLRVRSKGPNDLETLKSCVSTDEINATPIIKDLLIKNGKMMFNSITRLKPHLVPIKIIKDMKDKHEIKLVNSVESFRNIFYEYNNKIKMQKNDELNVYRGLKNYNFSKIYEHIKKRDISGEKEMLEEIENIYKKKDIPLPSIDNPENNLFKSNLLLTKDDDIKDSIMYKLSSEKSNEKTLSFLKNIRNNINNQLLGKQNRNLPKLYYKSNNSIKKNYLYRDLLTNNNKFKKGYIPSSKKYINSIQETINTMDELDYFFDSNNQQYFDYLKKQKNKKNQKKSKLSTTFNSTINENNEKKEKPKSKFSKTVKIYKFPRKKKEDSEKNNNKTSDTFIETKMLIDNKRATFTNDIDIYDIDDKMNNLKFKHFNRNPSMDNIKLKNEDDNMIKIQKVHLNDKVFNQKSSKKKISFPISRQRSMNNRLSITSKLQTNNHKANLNEQLFNLYPPKSTNNKIIHKVSKLNIKRNKSDLEIVYDKIKDKDDFNESSNIIKKFLNVKKCNIEPKVSRLEICHDYQNMREYLSRNDYLKKYLKLKEKSGFEDSSFDLINGEYHKYQTNLDNIAEKVNKVISEV
jgi:hypothetical protein